MQILDKKQIELAERIGTYWYKDGVERIYLDCVTFYGLQLRKATVGKVSYNILTAYCDGKRLDKKEADRLENMLRSGKVWVDYATGEFGSKNLEPEIFERIVNNFLKYLKDIEQKKVIELRSDALVFNDETVFRVDLHADGLLYIVEKLQEYELKGLRGSYWLELKDKRFNPAVVDYVSKNGKEGAELIVKKLASGENNIEVPILQEVTK